uniref:Motile sperm domain-containing protein 2 n=1 Tax=Aceria tosichella TaxID=561515 RepID=A0A6G1SQ07_9ACAR
MVTAEPAYLAASQASGANLSPQQDNVQQFATSANSINNNETTEPVSLSDSRTSDHSENVDLSTTPSSISDSDDDTSASATTRSRPSNSAPCSAVHTLERDMPDHDYSDLVVRLRELIIEHAQLNPGLYSPADLDKCQHDDWFLSRFLLRNKLQLDEAFDMLKRALRFNHESLASHLRPGDFPAEFYQLGGLIPYGHDRKGNKMLYLRVRLHRKTPEVLTIIQAFLYYNIKHLDDEAKGKGISLVIDCTGAGLANADMELLLFIINTLKSYFPKGLSYFLVHEMPWILKPFWHIAKAWVPDEHRQLIKFSDSRNINEFIDDDQLPDFMGGQVDESKYKRIPDDCVRLEQAAKLWGIEKRLIGRVLDKFKEHLPAETVARIEDYYLSTTNTETGDEQQQQIDNKQTMDENVMFRSDSSTQDR